MAKFDEAEVERGTEESRKILRRSVLNKRPQQVAESYAEQPWINRRGWDIGSTLADIGVGAAQLFLPKGAERQLGLDTAAQFLEEDRLGRQMASFGPSTPPGEGIVRPITEFASGAGLGVARPVGALGRMGAAERTGYEVGRGMLESGSTPPGESGLLPTALGGLMPGATQSLVRGGGNVLARQGIDQPEPDAGRVARLSRLSDEYDVPLSAPQLTGAAADRYAAQILRATPETSDAMAGFYRDQNNQLRRLYLAGEESLGEGRPTRQGEFGLEREAQQVGSRVLERAQRARTEATRPLYDTAFDYEGVDVDLRRPVAEMMEFSSRMGEGTKEAQAINELVDILAPEQTMRLPDGTETVERMVKSNPEQVSAAYRNARELVREWSDPTSPNYSRLKSQVGKRFVGQIESELGQSALWRKANQMYSDLSEPISRLKATPIGKLAKMDVKDDFNFNRVVGSIFGPQSNPETVSYMRSLFIQDGSEDVWNRIVKGYLQNRRRQIVKSTGADDVPNVGNQLKRVFAGEADDELNMFYAALGPERRRYFQDLKELLEASEVGRARESGTEAMQEIRSRVKFPGFTINVPRRLSEALASRATDRNMNRMLDAFLNADISEYRALFGRPRLNASWPVQAMVRSLTRELSQPTKSRMMEEDEQIT